MGEGTNALPRAVCGRDGVATLLRCANCGVPICPACLVRTEVGLRCPSCGAARPGAPLPTVRRRVPAVVAAGVLVLLAGVLAALIRQSSPAGPVPPPLPPQILEFEPLPPESTPPSRPPVVSRDPREVLRLVDRPDLGLSFGISPEWQVQPADPAGGVFLASSQPGPGPLAWVRVLVYPPGENVGATAQRVTTEVLAGRQGARDVAGRPTTVAGRPAWVVTFKVPVNPDGTGPLTDQTYYFLPTDRGVVALAFGTLDFGGHAALVSLTMATVKFT